MKTLIKMSAFFLLLMFTLLSCRTRTTLIEEGGTSPENHSEPTTEDPPSPTPTSIPGPTPTSIPGPTSSSTPGSTSSSTPGSTSSSTSGPTPTSIPGSTPVSTSSSTPGSTSSSTPGSTSSSTPGSTSSSTPTATMISAAKLLTKNFGKFLKTKKDKNIYKHLKNLYNPAATIEEVIIAYNYLESKNKLDLIDVTYLLNAPHNRVTHFLKYPSKYIQNEKYKTIPGLWPNFDHELVVGYDGLFYKKGEGREKENVTEAYYLVNQWGRLFISLNNFPDAHRIFCKGKITIENGILRKISNEGMGASGTLTAKEHLDGVLLLFQIQGVSQVIPYDTTGSLKQLKRLKYGYTLGGVDSYDFEPGPAGSVNFAFLQTESNFVTIRAKPIDRDRLVWRGMKGITDAIAQSFFNNGIDASAVFYYLQNQALQGPQKPIVNMQIHQSQVSNQTFFLSNSKTRATSESALFSGLPGGYVFKIRFKKDQAVSIYSQSPQTGLTAENEIVQFYKTRKEDIIGYYKRQPGGGFGPLVPNPNFEPVEEEGGQEAYTFASPANTAFVDLVFSKGQQIVHGTTIRKTSLPSLTKKSASYTLESPNILEPQIHESLDPALCGRVAPAGNITKTGTFLITMNPTNKKYYVLLARKTRQGEINRHFPNPGMANYQPPEFGSVLVPAKKWGKWVTMGGGTDWTCNSQSSLCAAHAEVKDEANAPHDVLRKIVYLDCKIMGNANEKAIFTGYVNWWDARRITDGHVEQTFVGLQSQVVGAGTPYCIASNCNEMKLFPATEQIQSRADLIVASHDEIGYVKWVPMDDVLQHPDLMSYVTDSFNNFFAGSFKEKIENLGLWNENLDCAGDAPWKFGKYGKGAAWDPLFPFITGATPNNCAAFTAAQSQAIVDGLLNPVQANQADPLAIFVVGPPGSGKSSRGLSRFLADKNLDKADFVHIDSDDLRTKHPDFINLTQINSDRCVGKFRSYAGATPSCLGPIQNLVQLPGGIYTQVLGSKRNFIYDSAGSDSGFIMGFINQAHADGYKVYLVAAWAPKKYCQDRVKKRAFETGRWAEAAYIDNIFNRFENPLYDFKGMSDLTVNGGGEVLIFDNSSAKLRKVYHRSSAGEVKSCDQKEFACQFYRP